MGRPSVVERYFAQCQAHHTPPRPELIAGFRDGVIDVNLAEIPSAAIRLFTCALLHTSAPTGVAQLPAVPPHNSLRQRSRQDAASASNTCSQQSAGGDFSQTQFVKLHFSYHTTLPAAHLSRGAASPPASSTLLSTKNKSTLQCLPEAVAQAVKESAGTLSSFAWCDMPLTTMAARGRDPLPQRRGGAQVPPSLTHVLPLCHRLTSLRLDSVPLSHAQFMQLIMFSPKSPAASADGGVAWPALEEASFVRCGLTDTCKVGLVHLLRAAVTLSSGSMWQRSLRCSYANPDDRPLPQPAASTLLLGYSSMRGLKRLDVSQNPLGDETARAIATAIPGSPLRYLNVSSTSITWVGGSLLASPPVLENTAMELVDMSNTGISKMFAHAESAAETKILAESSVVAGFRVVARGMGQLLILRESTRSPQQPWPMLLTTSPIPQPLPAHASGLPHVKSPTPTPACMIQRETENVAPPVSTKPAPFVNTEDQHSAPQLAHTVAAAPGTAVSPYGLWWPLLTSWYAAQGIIGPVGSAAVAATGSSADAPGKGYVPVPVPFPMFAPMPMAFTAPHGADFLLPRETPAAFTASPAVGAVAEGKKPCTERGASPSTPGDPPDATPVPLEPLPPTSSAGENNDEAGGESLTGGLVHPLDSASTASETSACSASASDGLVHRASETAGDRKFLLGLISRLEAYESDIAERLETQYQRTTTQLTLLEKDMRFRLQQLADTDRKQQTAAADRQTALLEALAALRTEPGAVTAEGMTEAMLPQLMHLIEVGMEKVQAALGAEGAVGVKSAKDGEGKASSPLLRSREVATHVGATTITDRDLVTTASQRLKELGW
ncbi:hypothetical protein MNV84_08166 [Leishmania braziliensis]|nr:hypothetical protein MNV84_08166 [Leishmania braziliensis]